VHRHLQSLRKEAAENIKECYEATLSRQLLMAIRNFLEFLRYCLGLDETQQQQFISNLSLGTVTLSLLDYALILQQAILDDKVELANCWRTHLIGISCG